MELASCHTSGTYNVLRRLLDFEKYLDPCLMTLVLYTTWNKDTSKQLLFSLSTTTIPVLANQMERLKQEQK